MAAGQGEVAEIPHSPSESLLLPAFLATLWVFLLAMPETFVWRICQSVLVKYPEI